MEISVIASSQVNLGRNYDSGLFNFGKNLSGEICSLKNSNLKASYLVPNQSLKWPSKSAVGFTLRASSSHSEQNPVISRTNPVDEIKLFVGLPLDTVSGSNKINRARAINAGLKTLKLLGVNGVELPIWWGVAEKEGMGKYDWTSYLTVVEMVQKLGLELHVSLCFHASEESKIRLPEWVSRIGKGNSDIYFADKSGQQLKDCLSFGVDDVPVLDGKTPVEVYKGFCDDFKATFSPFLGSTITSVSIGLGPDGELRYPHHHRPEESHYSQLLSHGDRLLSLASSTFKDSSISISGRVPLVHSWDSYDGVSRIFSRNGCGMILPRMDLPDSGLEEITSSCRRHGVSVSGENSPPSSTSGDVFDRIEKTLHSDATSSVDTFTYQRMGASFFSPEHFALFVRFSRCLNRPVRRFNNVAVRDGRDDEFFLDPRRLQTA